MPETDAEFLFVRFEMNIRGSLLDGVKQNLVDEADDWRVIDIAGYLRGCPRRFAPAQADGVEIDIHQILESRVGGFDSYIDGLGEFVLLDDDNIDDHVRVELDLVVGQILAGIGRGQEQAIAALHQRQHMMLENQLFADGPDWHEIRKKSVQIEQRYPEDPRGG